MKKITLVLFVICMIIFSCSELAFNNPFADLHETTTTIAKYYIEFNPNGGSGSMDRVTAKVGQSLILPNCTFNPPSIDYKFAYWNQNSGENLYLNMAKVIDLTTDNNASVTLYAQWIEKSSHLIIYNNLLF